MESRTADIIQETRKHIKKKPNGSEVQSQAPNHSSQWQQTQMQTDQELQLKASRDVRWPLCITGSYNGKNCVHGLLEICAFFSTLEATPQIGISTENN
jgi:hypothetical protein